MIGVSVVTSICRFLAIKFHVIELLFIARFVSAILSAVTSQTQMLFCQVSKKNIFLYIIDLYIFLL